MVEKSDNADVVEPPASAPEAPQPAAETKTVPFSQFQNLQRELNKLQKRNKELAGIAAQTSTTSTAPHLEEMVQGIIDGLKSTELIDAQKLEAIRTKGEATRTLAQRVGQARGLIANLLEGEGVDWDTDERLSEARAAWEAGQFEEAVRITKSSTTSSNLTPDKIQPLIDQAVQKAKKEMGWVDTGVPTGGGKRLASRKDWENIAPGSQDEADAIAAVKEALNQRRR